MYRAATEWEREQSIKTTPNCGLIAPFSPSHHQHLYRFPRGLRLRPLRTLQLSQIFRSRARGVPTTPSSPATTASIHVQHKCWLLYSPSAFATLVGALRMYECPMKLSYTSNTTYIYTYSSYTTLFGFDWTLKYFVRYFVQTQKSQQHQQPNNFPTSPK